MKRILNIGCGDRLCTRREADWYVVNHDRVKHSPSVDICHDLNVFPWPWKDNSFDVIQAWAVLEHLENPLPVNLDECWRILAPQGLLILDLPLWRAESSHRDPTHRWWFTEDSLDFLDPNTDWGSRYSFYGYKPWKILKRSVIADGASLYVEMEPRK